MVLVSCRHTVTWYFSFPTQSISVYTKPPTTIDTKVTKALICGFSDCTSIARISSFILHLHTHTYPSLPISDALPTSGTILFQSSGIPARVFHVKTCERKQIIWFFWEGGGIIFLSASHCYFLTLPFICLLCCI